jgi:hypothetical protein
MNPSDAAGADSLESDTSFPFGTGESRLSYRPIWNVQQKAMAIYLCELSPASGGPREPAATGRADCRLLRGAVADIERMKLRQSAGSVSIPVHHATLANAARRDAFAAQCDAIAPALRALLVWEIAGMPPDAGERDLFSMVSMLKPYGRAIFLRSRLAKADFDTPAAVGVHSIGVDLGETTESETRIAARLEKFAENAHRSGLRSHVHGLTTSSMSLAAVSSGFHYLSGDAICASAAAPWGVLPFDAERLFLHRHMAGD